MGAALHLAYNRDYYARTASVNSDGTPLFASQADKRSELDTARAIGEAWNCEVREFAPLSSIDWYAIRDGRLVGVLELKTRSHERGRYETVFLNVRKWNALLLAEIGLGVPAVFIVRWDDATGYIRASAVDARRHVIGGCRRIVKAASDIEPVIEVPICDMRLLG